MASILLVHAAEHTAEASPLEALLRRSHDVRRVTTVSHARLALVGGEWDAVILDGNHGDGLELVGELRGPPRPGQPVQRDDLVIMVVTDRGDLAARLMGFAVGCDDWLPLEVHPLEVAARLDARLRRQGRHAELTLPGLHIDLEGLRVVVDDPGGAHHPLTLTALEFRLLLHFARHVDHVIDRDHLLSAVWGDDISVLDRTVDTHVCHLRRKLALSSWTIEAVPRLGYRFTATTTAATAAADPCDDDPDR